VGLWCERDTFWWCPPMTFPAVFPNDLVPCPNPKCPSRGPEGGSTLHVKRKGMSPVVKVIDIDGTLTLGSLRYVGGLID
jgi:hypothetical protein